MKLCKENGGQKGRLCCLFIKEQIMYIVEIVEIIQNNF